MKFSKQLAYNSVAEWQLHYMDYARLKKVITALKRVHDALFAARSRRGGSGGGGAAAASQSRVLATRPVTYGHAGPSRVLGSASAGAGGPQPASSSQAGGRAPPLPPPGGGGGTPGVRKVPPDTVATAAVHRLGGGRAGADAAGDGRRDAAATGSLAASTEGAKRGGFQRSASKLVLAELATLAHRSHHGGAHDGGGDGLGLGGVDSPPRSPPPPPSSGSSSAPGSPREPPPQPDSPSERSALLQSREPEQEGWVGAGGLPLDGVARPPGAPRAAVGAGSGMAAGSAVVGPAASSGGGLPVVRGPLPVSVSLGLPFEAASAALQGMSVEALSREFDAIESTFFRRLDGEATKVDAFYTRMVVALEKISLELAAAAARRDETGGVEVGAAALQRRYVEHYLELTELINFAELNLSGFEKILKKHDKNVMATTRSAYIAKLERSRAFCKRDALVGLRERTEREFADLFWGGDTLAAREELSEGLRDLLIWERNTIWRDMLQSERRVAAVRSKKRGGSTSSRAVMLAARPLLLAMGLFLFAGILLYPRDITARLPQGEVGDTAAAGGATKLRGSDVGSPAAADRCLALLVLTSFLWATEALPLYVTSLGVAPAAVLLRVFLGSDGKPLHASEAAHVVMAAMGDQVIMLIICVYSLAAALSKLGLDKVAATAVLSRVRRPSSVLLVVMLLAVFLSMWVSNVASPVLLNSVVLPVLRGLPPSSHHFVQCILLGVALASNIGGMPSPIASPQNAVALGQLKGLHEVSFIEWMAATLPQCIIMVFAAHALLMAWFRPGNVTLPLIPRHTERFEWPHYVVLTTLLTTVGLWCYKPTLSVAGADGLVAVLPILVFFGTGILTKEDFNNLPWNVVYLVAGGIALGAAVQSSTLLALVAGTLHFVLRHSSLWQVFAVFSVFMSLVSNAISHTVSALIVLPVIAEVGASVGHPRLLVMGAVLACSGAMALPVSSFPNMASVSVENETGKRYLHASDVIKLGTPMTLISATVVISFGYVLMLAMGF